MTAVTPGEDRVRLLYRMRARRLFWRMLQHQGIDPSRPWWHGLDAMIDRAVARCGDCQQTEACHSWLDHPADRKEPPVFCPNGEAMAAARIAACETAESGAQDAKEVDLRQLLDDPIMRRLMAADRVNAEILRYALSGLRHFTAAYAAPQQIPCRKSSAK